MRLFLILWTILAVSAADASEGQTRQKMERIYRAAVKGKDYVGAANIKLRLGDKEGAARNLRRALFQAKKEKDYSRYTSILDRLEKLEWEIRQDEKKSENSDVSRLPPKPGAPKPAPSGSEWLWASGGLLKLREDGVATHSLWKRSATWSKNESSEIKLVGEAGTFRIIKASDGVVGVYRLGGGHTVLNKLSTVKMAYEKRYKVENYNGLGDDAVVRFSPDGVGRYWGPSEPEDGVACTWLKNDQGSFEIRRSDSEKNTGWIFVLDEKFQITNVYEKVYRRNLPVHAVSEVSLHKRSLEKALEKILSNQSWELRVDPPHGKEIEFVKGGSIGLGRTDYEHRWALKNGRLFLHTKKDEIGRAFRYDFKTRQWLVDASITCKLPLSPKMAIVPK